MDAKIRFWTNAQFDFCLKQTEVRTDRYIFLKNAADPLCIFLQIAVFYL